ncbi:hypothetical protein B0H14DRAFT_2625991 [Mycena olivaceomarginata]|nr:hypothetical protein B0H14DRAFT_2625991 [Mycena olivaceomarginata]
MTRVRDCQGHGKGTEASGSGVPGVGRRSQRYGDVMRRTRGNGLKATGKDTAMNEQRNDPGEGLLELWGRGQGIRMGGAKEGGVPEWRWTEIAEAETARVVKADKVRSWGRVRNNDRKIRRTRRHGGIVTQKGDNHEEESRREWLGVRSRSTATRIPEGTGGYRKISGGRSEATKNKGIKGKGKHSVILHCIKTPVAQKTGSSEYHQRQCGLDLEPESGRDSDQGSSGLEAEPEDSLGGVVVKG